MGEDNRGEKEQFLEHLGILMGWSCLGTSSFLLHRSTTLLALPESEQSGLVLFMTCARLAGMAAFAVGLWLILQQRWTAGGLLLLGSVGLPFVSLLIHGTL